MAAYRAGARLDDRRSERPGGQKDRVVDYRRKRGVAHAEIMAPEDSAEWLRDRTELWNRVEAMEKRHDAQLAREINLALPAELTAEARLALVRDYVRTQFVAEGMVADVAIHAPIAARGDNIRNHHAHIMLTLRQATAEGLRATKTREWNAQDRLAGWRAAWAEAQNRALERAGVRERVDHRSLQAQRAEAVARGDRMSAAMLDRLPELHEGPRARKLATRVQVRSRQVERSTARPVAGGWVSAKTRAKRTRVVDYASIDRGTRSAYARSRLEARQAHTARRQERAERQAARGRDQLLRLERQLRMAHAPKGRARADLLLRLTRELERLLAGLTARRRADRLRLQELVKAHEIGRALGLTRGRGRERRR